MTKQEKQTKKQKIVITTHSVYKQTFMCDVCGKEKTGKKHPVFDENWNKQKGLVQCEGCYICTT